MQDKQNKSTTTIALKAYSPKELRDIYGVSVKTFRVWLEPHKETIGKLCGKRYTVKQVEFIFSVLGTPGHIHITHN